MGIREGQQEDEAGDSLRPTTGEEEV